VRRTRLLDVTQRADEILLRQRVGARQRHRRDDHHESPRREAGRGGRRRSRAEGTDRAARDRHRTVHGDQQHAPHGEEEEPRPQVVAGREHEAPAEQRRQDERASRHPIPTRDAQVARQRHQRAAAE
jgi:hypothetical protein